MRSRLLGAVCGCVSMFCVNPSVNASPIFSNSPVVTTVTNTATFDGISGSLFGYTEDNIVVSVNDNHCCFADAHYGSGGNNDWVTISLVGGELINELDFLLGDGWTAFSGAATTNLIWEAFVGATSTGFGDVLVNTGSIVGWTDLSGFTSIRVAANSLDINAFGDFQAIALDNVRISAVPIPAAVWLFGSGLLGMIGIARRNKAA